MLWHSYMCMKKLFQFKLPLFLGAYLQAPEDVETMGVSIFAPYTPIIQTTDDYKCRAHQHEALNLSREK